MMDVLGFDGSDDFNLGFDELINDRYQFSKKKQRSRLVFRSNTDQKQLTMFWVSQSNLIHNTDTLLLDTGI